MQQLCKEIPTATLRIHSECTPVWCPSHFFLLVLSNSGGQKKRRDGGNGQRHILTPYGYTRRPAGSDPQPAFTLSTIPTGLGGEDDKLENAGVQQRPLLQIGQVASEWIDIDPSVVQSLRERMCSGFDAGELVRWTGIDILTQFPGPSTYEALPWMTSPGGAGNGHGHGHGYGPANILCSSKCEVHPQLAKATAAAAMMDLQGAAAAVPDRHLGGNWNLGRTEEIVSWLMTLETSARLGAPTSQPPSDTAHQDMSLLPVPATKQNADLLRICAWRAPVLPYPWLLPTVQTQKASMGY